MKKIPFEILISTMNQTNFDFLDRMFQNCSKDGIYLLIVNQTSEGNELNSNIQNIRVINSYEKGLSKSRNLLLDNAIGEICLIADDDIVYNPNFKQIILKSYKELPKADAINFALQYEEGKPYYNYSIDYFKYKTSRIKYVSSVIITFKLKKVINRSVSFNQNFGIGSTFPVGEDFLFVRDMIKKNLNVFFRKKFILNHVKDGTGKNASDNTMIFSRSAMAYKRFSFFAYPWAIKYIYSLIMSNEILAKHFCVKLKSAFAGIKKYRTLTK